MPVFGSTPYQQRVLDFVTPLYKQYDTSADFPYFNSHFLKSQKPKWHFGVQVNVVPYRLQMYFFEYADSLATDAALSALLANFPKDGGTIDRCVNLKGIKSPPAIYLVGYNSISMLIQMCEEAPDSRDAFAKRFMKGMSFKHYYTIKVGCGGPLVWDCSKK